MSVAKNEVTDGLVKLFGRRYSYRQQNRRFSIAGLSEPFYYKKPDSRTRTTSYVEDLFGDSQSALAKAKLEFSIGAEAGDLKLNFTFYLPQKTQIIIILLHGLDGCQ